MTNLYIADAIASIEKSLREATTHFESEIWGGEGSQENDGAISAYYMERAMVALLVLAEHLNLRETVSMVRDLLKEARSRGFDFSKMGTDQPYLVWPDRIRTFVDGIASVHGLGETDQSEMKDLKQVMRRSVYAICDPKLFPHMPSKEADVHDRIEAILKCYFPDLLRKPALSKSIKNFEPDTGLPSTKTLIEYKFVTSKLQARRVVDEILADVSGYRSAEWRSLLFVIYETNRVMSEDEWTQLLRQCGLGTNYDAVVLSGDAGTLI